MMDNRLRKRINLSWDVMPVKKTTLMPNAEQLQRSGRLQTIQPDRWLIPLQIGDETVRELRREHLCFVVARAMRDEPDTSFFDDGVCGGSITGQRDEGSEVAIGIAVIRT